MEELPDLFSDMLRTFTVQLGIPKSCSRGTLGVPI